MQVERYCYKGSILQYFGPFVDKTFVLSFFEWPFYTGFTVNRKRVWPIMTLMGVGVKSCTTCYIHNSSMTGLFESTPKTDRFSLDV